jgi:hypothetical protein
MIGLDDHLLDLVKQGVVSREEALAASQLPKDLEERLA